MAILIKLDSKGPVFFSQERVGEKQKTYMVHKFRSMVQDAETKSGPVWARSNDCRITRVGRFLRKWRIDEICPNCSMSSKGKWVSSGRDRSGDFLSKSGRGNSILRWTFFGRARLTGGPRWNTPMALRLKMPGKNWITICSISRTCLSSWT